MKHLHTMVRVSGLVESLHFGCERLMRDWSHQSGG
jgi:hypothetical protein